MTSDTPIRIFCTLGMRGVLLDLAPTAAARGCAFDASFQSSNGLMSRIANGEMADIAVLTRAALDTLIADGKVTAGSRVDLARSGVGLAVRAGAPKPDIGSADALRRALLAARSVAYTRTGASGIHFARVIAELGIADAINAKAKIADGFAGEAVARGEVEIAVQQLSELMQVPGLDIVGPLPDELQQSVTFTAGIFAGAARPEAARALVALLAARDSAPVIARHGLVPI
jgi:molybdate transport system substrate-binding protein